jgi:hypothetical protein
VIYGAVIGQFINSALIFARGDSERFGRHPPFFPHKY